MRVLVTGGAGYLGQHLLRYLLDRGHYVRSFDNYLYGLNGVEHYQGHPRCELWTGDIRSHADMLAATEGIDAVIALAALVGDAACDVDEQVTWAINVEATRVLVDVCRENQIARVVIASTCSVYGASSRSLLSEDSALNPVSLYAQSRIESERILHSAGASLAPVMLRLGTLYGDSSRHRFDLVVNTLSVRAAALGAISIFGGDQWRPNLHVRDAARAFAMAAEAPAERVAGRTFNVGSETQNYRIAELGAIIQQLRPSLKVSYEPLNDPRDYRVSFQRIRQALGYQAHYSLAQGAQEIMGLIDSGRITDIQAPLYNNFRWVQAHIAGLRQITPLVYPARTWATEDSLAG